MILKSYYSRDDNVNNYSYFENRSSWRFEFANHIASGELELDRASLRTLSFDLIMPPDGSTMNVSPDEESTSSQVCPGTSKSDLPNSSVLIIL